MPVADAVTADDFHLHTLVSINLTCPSIRLAISYSAVFSLQFEKDSKDLVRPLNIASRCHCDGINASQTVVQASADLGMILEVLRRVFADFFAPCHCKGKISNILRFCYDFLMLVKIIRDQQ